MECGRNAYKRICSWCVRQCLAWLICQVFCEYCGGKTLPTFWVVSHVTPNSRIPTARGWREWRRRLDTCCGRQRRCLPRSVGGIPFPTRLVLVGVWCQSHLGGNTWWSFPSTWSVDKKWWCHRPVRRWAASLVYFHNTCPHVSVCSSRSPVLAV